MSGPKDFVVVFAVERMLAMQVRRAAAEQQRTARLRARQELARERAAIKAAKKEQRDRVKADQQAARELALKRQASLAAANQAATSEQLRQAAAAHAEEKNAKEIARRSRAILAARKSLGAGNEADEPVQATPPYETEWAMPATPIIGENRQAVEVGKVPAGSNEVAAGDRWQSLQADLDAWQQELATDEAVQQFEAVPTARWQQDVRALSTTVSDPLPADMNDLVARCQILCETAERIHREAGERQGKFETRNELLSDIMRSLQEIGFFVADPEYQDPSDPAGPVIVKATRAGEEIHAAVDLGDMVRSVWNGVAEENCKDSFFEYVDRMKAKGIDVRAIRNDLQSRPELKHAGAKELPRSDSRRQGG